MCIYYTRAGFVSICVFKMGLYYVYGSLAFFNGTITVWFSFHVRHERLSSPPPFF